MDITIPGPQVASNTFTPDLLGYIFTFTESIAAESLVSKSFYSISRLDFVCKYFFSELHSIVGEDYSDEFDSLIDRQEGDAWILLNKKAIKYFNDLRKLTDLAPIVLPKKKGDYISTSLISIFRQAYQDVVDKNLFSFCKSINNKDLKDLVLEKKPNLIRQYLKNTNTLQIEELILCNNALTLVPPELCECTTLKKLLLPSNRLKTVPKCFSNLVNLTTCGLELSPEIHPPFCTPLTTLKAPSPLFTFTTLKVLYLWGSQEIKFPETFGNLTTTLTEFTLRNMPLKLLPPSFSSLENLTKLDLASTSIEDFPRCLLGLSNLRTLNFITRMKNLKTTNFPESFDRLTNLSELKIAAYPITNQTESLGSLFNLTKLNFMNTKIEIFPPWIFKLTNLRKLTFEVFMQELQLETNHKPMNSPESFDNKLTNLTKLSIRDYPITTLPESLGSLVSLTKLNFMFSKVQVLPACIFKLTNLTHLILNHTPLHEEYKRTNDLSNRLLEGLPNLVRPNLLEDS